MLSVYFEYEYLDIYIIYCPRVINGRRLDTILRRIIYCFLAKLLPWNCLYWLYMHTSDLIFIWSSTTACFLFWIFWVWCPEIHDYACLLYISAFQVTTFAIPNPPTSWPLGVQIFHSQLQLKTAHPSTLSIHLPLIVRCTGPGSGRTWGTCFSKTTWQMSC